MYIAQYFSGNSFKERYSKCGKIGSKYFQLVTYKILGFAELPFLW